MKAQRSSSTYHDLQLGRDVTDADSLAIGDLLEISDRAARPASSLSPEAFFTALPPLLNTYEIAKKNYRGYRKELRAQENTRLTEKEDLFRKICF